MLQIVTVWGAWGSWQVGVRSDWAEDGCCKPDFDYSHSINPFLRAVSINTVSTWSFSSRFSLCRNRLEETLGSFLCWPCVGSRCWTIASARTSAEGVPFGIARGLPCSLYYRHPSGSEFSLILSQVYHLPSLPCSSAIDHRWSNIHKCS